MSNIIIIINPIKVQSVIKFLLLLVWLSGINSQTTTYIIAPAANDNKNGNKAWTLITNNAPITAEIGYTIALSWPKKKALNFE